MSFLRLTVIIRMVECLCGIIVFAPIVDKCMPTVYGETYCAFSSNVDHCHYGIAIGVLMFVFALFLIVGELMQAANPNALYYLIDASLSAVLALMALIAFCLLANDWREADTTYYSTSVKNAAQSALAFLFFSTFLWAVSVYLAIRERGKSGSAQSNSSYAEPAQTPEAGAYASFVDRN